MQIWNLEKRIQPQNNSLKSDLTTPAMTNPAHDVTGAEYAPPL